MQQSSRRALLSSGPWALVHIERDGRKAIYPFMTYDKGEAVFCSLAFVFSSFFKKTAFRLFLSMKSATFEVGIGILPNPKVFQP